MNRSQIISTLRLYPAACLFLLLTTATLFAQQRTATDVNYFAAAPYAVGERLTYNVSFSQFATAAHVEMTVAARGEFYNREALQLRAHVETVDVVSAALLPLNNDYVTYVDPRNGLPFRSEQTTRSGTLTDDASRDYNQPIGTGAIPSKLTLGEVPGTYDLLSALYRVRALQLFDNADYRISVVHNGAPVRVRVRVRGRELVKTSVGSFSALVVEMRALDNRQFGGNRVRVFMTDDERHVPVLISAEVAAGEIRAELVSSNLPAVPAPSVTNSSGALVAQQTSQTNNVTVPMQPAVNATPVVNNAALPANVPFKVGEQLNFDVFLGSVAQPVGSISMQVKPRANYFNRDGLLLALQAQTNGAGAKLFPINDQINAYIDPATLLPFRVEMRLSEGRRKNQRTLLFDQTYGAVVKDGGARLNVPVGTYDILSALYALRSFDLSPAKRTGVALLAINRPRTLYIATLAQETIEVGGERIPAVQLALTTDDPQPDRYQLRLWISSDARRLPLRLTAVTPLGVARAELKIISVTNQ